jgi:hypothetical protein
MYNSRNKRRDGEHKYLSRKMCCLKLRSDDELASVLAVGGVNYTGKFWI